MLVPEESLIGLWLGIVLLHLMSLQIVGDVTIETEVETIRIIENLVQLLCDASLNVSRLPYAH